MQSRPFSSEATQFITWMQHMGYAETTIESYTRRLQIFLSWLPTQPIEEMNSITQETIEQYNQYLHQQPNQLFSGALSSSYIQSHLNVIRLLDKYLQLFLQMKQINLLSLKGGIVVL